MFVAYNCSRFTLCPVWFSISVLFFKLPAGCRKAATCLYKNLFTGQKSAFSPHRDDPLHRFAWNLAQPRGTWVRYAVQKFTAIGARGGHAAPQNGKNFHFLVKSRPTGANPLTDFCIVRGFYTASCPALVFYILLILFTGYGVMAEKPRLNHLPPKYSVYPAGKTMHWIEK